MTAPIDRVRVYERGATVFRRATLEGFASTAEVAGLPLSLADETVRVRSLTDGVVAGAVRIGLHAKPPEETPDSPDEVALRDVERRIETLDRTLAMVEAETDLLRGLEVPERPRGKDGKPPPASPMRARVALDQFADEAIQARLDEARGLRRDRLRLAEEAEALRDAIRRASLAKRARPDRLTKVVLVDLAGSAKGAVELELEYFVPGARWAPQYSCDIAADGSRATLTLRALVCQASGEDWRNVALELSTAVPQGFTELPELASIRIGKAQPPPSTRGYRDPPAGAGALFGDFDRDWTRVHALLPQRVGFQAPPLEVGDLDGLDDLVLGLSEAADKGAYRDVDEEPAPEPAVASELAMDFDDGFGGAPAPPPPAPQMMRSRAAAPGKPSPKKARKLVEREEQESERGGEGGSAPAVSFARLRLGAPASAQRGTLRTVDRVAEYAALLRRSGLEVDFDLASVVHMATRRAEQAGRQGLPADAVDVRQAAGQYDYAYRADDRVDVPSDLAFHSVPLGVREAECRVTYVVVPRVDTNVFRVASVHNPTHAPLLPGPAEVYVGGEYVVSTKLPSVAPRERFELGLGVEQALRCARNTRFREERAGKAVVAMAELHHEVDIELHNPLPRAIQCEVRERIPQAAKDAEVDVEEVSVAPAWVPYDQLELGRKVLGGRRWTIEVAPRSSAKLSAHYVVKIYANNEIVGGNRREA
ncbi:MAG: DUF4139 domain-containing protein [Myxococcota bacterium]